MNLVDAWVGRVRERRAYLDAWPVQALCATLGGPFDGERETLPCPWHWLYFLETASREDIDIDGHPKRGDFMPPIDLPRRMFAGGRTRVIKPLRLGAPASLKETILRVEQKRGGESPLHRVTVGHAVFQDGVLCVEEERDIVYLGAGPAPIAIDAPEVAVDEAAPWRSDLVPDPVMLMRFSALTFNSHRIHYDRDYTQAQEGYPERVVHGPLTAMLLLELARTSTQREITGFSFRAQSPLFVNSRLRLRGGPAEDGSVTLTAYTPDARVAMTATVSLAD